MLLQLPDPTIAGGWSEASFVLGIFALVAMVLGRLDFKGFMGFFIGWQLLTLESLIVGGSSLLAIGPACGWLTVAAMTWNRAR